MNVYISVDMEGVAGVAHEDQTDPVNPAHAVEYARFRRLMTDEANAAIQGAASAGASRILVNDSHWLMRNLLAEELHEAAELISSGPKRLSMMEGVDGGFDAVMCIGYHAMAGTRHATIDHTYTDKIHQVKLNGRPVGELGINAARGGLLRRAGGDGVGRPGAGRRRRMRCWGRTSRRWSSRRRSGASPRAACRRPSRAGASAPAQHGHCSGSMRPSRSHRP